MANGDSPPLNSIKELVTTLGEWCTTLSSQDRAFVDQIQQAFLAVGEDLRDTRQALQQRNAELSAAYTTLEEERDVLHATIENAHAQLAYLDPDFNFVWANAAYAQSTNMVKDILIGRNYFDLFSDAENQAFFEQVRNSGTAAVILAKPHTAPPDSEYETTYWDWVLSPVHNKAGRLRGLVLSLHDVTDRVQNTEELECRVARRTAAWRASQARFQAIFEDAAVGIALVDHQGQVVTSNPALQRMLGYTATELEALPLAALTDAHNHVDDMVLYSELLAGEREYYQVEGRYLHKDGRVIYANLTVSIVRWQNVNEHFALVMIEDITARKQAQAALIQSEKLALTGRLAAALAHEINNPLQSVIGFMSLAKELVAEEADPQTVADYIQIGIEEVKRAANIVAQMRDLNRKASPGERQPEDVNALLTRALTLSQKKFQERHVTVEWHAAEDLPLIPLSPNRIQQVFLNLLLNALEAMPEGGKLRVSTLPNATPLGVWIRFADTGVGIPAAKLDQLFEPFFTTKPTGMGLGLYVSQMIVEEHGGQITVESIAGEGAVFTLWLPCASELPSPSQN